MGGERDGGKVGEGWWVGGRGGWGGEEERLEWEVGWEGRGETVGRREERREREKRGAGKGGGRREEEEEREKKEKEKEGEGGQGSAGGEMRGRWEGRGRRLYGYILILLFPRV